MAADFLVADFLVACNFQWPRRQQFLVEIVLLKHLSTCGVLLQRSAAGAPKPVAMGSNPGALIENELESDSFKDF